MKANKIWPRIFVYVLVTFSFTWVVALLIVLKVIPGYFHYATGFGPLIGAFTLFLMDRQLWSTIKELLVVKKPYWFWIGGLSPILLGALLMLVLKIIGYPSPSLSDIGKVSFLGDISFLVVPLWIFTFGLGEEFGWRGFLYPELKKKYSSLTATLILWVIWLAWHIPFFFYLPTYSNMNIGMIIGFAFSLLSGAILLNWLFEKSGRNLSTTILWHGMFNLITASAFGSGNIAMMLSMLVIFFSLAIFSSWVLPKAKVLNFLR